MRVRFYLPLENQIMAAFLFLVGLVALFLFPPAGIVLLLIAFFLAVSSKS